ncbi:MAG: CvpA family protein [Oscillospiraceae bacterium]|nr:CvpA family protein [Oscillospiraceae bacterium]
MGEFTWVIFDVLALLVLIIAVTKCASGGFVKGVLGLVSAAASAIGAIWLSAPLAVFIYERFLRSVIMTSIYNQLTEQMETGFAGLVPALLAGIIFAAASTIDPMAIHELGPAIETAVDGAVAPPVIALLRVIFATILFIIFLLISRRVVSVFRAVNRIPLVGPINSALGGLLGVGWAALIVWSLALVTYTYIAITDGGGTFVNAENLGRGYLFSFMFRVVS